MTRIQTLNRSSERELALQTRGLSAAVPTVPMNRRTQETMREYERPIPGVSGRDVLCAWIVALALFLALSLLSLVQEGSSDHSKGVTVTQTAFGAGEIRTGHQEVSHGLRLDGSTQE